VKTTFRQLTFTLKFIGSVLYFGARAFWYFCSIPLGELDSNIGSETYGDVAFTRGGSQLNHARNDLDALIVNAEVKDFTIGEKK
jgi:hypothetical protein